MQTLEAVRLQIATTETTRRTLPTVALKAEKKYGRPSLRPDFS